MVVTRSTRSQARLQRTSRSSREKSSADGIQTQPGSRNESESDDGSTAASQSSGTQSSIRKSRASSLAEITELSADGETSEAESNSSCVSEAQEPILRITRRRQIVIPPTPQNSVRKRQKMTPIHESLDEEISEAESHTSGISRVKSTIEITRSRRKTTKYISVLSQETHAESDAESSCSGISSCGILPRRMPRNRQRKLQAEAEKEDTQIIQGNEKQAGYPSVNSEDSNTRQTSQLPAKSHSPSNKPSFGNIETYNDLDDSFHRNSEKLLTVQNHHLDRREENQADGVPFTGIQKDCKNLNKEDIKITHEKKEINKNSSQLDNLSELQDTSFQQSVSQKHSPSPNNETTSQASSLNRENIMKSLAQTFAVVKVNRWSGERKGSINTSELTHFGDDSGSDEQPTSIGDLEDRNSPKLVDLECDTSLCKSELSTSQEVDGSVLLVLSSDESQQSENSEDEEDALSVIDNSGQKKSVSGASDNSPCDSALFVIDTTPGLNADKYFYLEDKASEAAIEEEEEEEEDENSEEDSSDSDKNKDECSDEEDFLNNTKSKLLKLTSSSIDPGLSIKQLGGLYINFSADRLQPKKKILTQIKEKKKDELLRKTVITPDFEKKDCVPPYSESKHQLQKKRRQERQKTAGDGWFGMKAPELTEELKNDLKALKMRASMDPKRFYKKNDRDGFPKYFQVGTIVDNPADFYHSRVPKKQRKKTIVEELLADSEFRRFNRRKYSEIMAEKAANAAGKKFRKKKKFRN
uniref:Deoxynucleotidyltransferase, terminal, interacting protein 2 n=1 Tax=Jaculus jaculus TaxID=51337 RepID=A0A8C5LFF1_JACJA